MEKSGRKSAVNASPALPYKSPLPAMKARSITGAITVTFAALASAPAPPFRQKKMTVSATAVPANTSGDILEITPSARAFKTVWKK